MKNKFKIIGFFILTILISNCNENSTISSNENIVIDASDAIPKGGDPRGTYIPNTPFVFYFGKEKDSLTTDTAEGILKIDGTTSTSGSFSYELDVRLGGRIGDNICAYFPYIETLDGTWIVEGNILILSANDQTDEIMFSRQNDALLLILDHFQERPFQLTTYDPQLIEGTTVFVFK